jgi:hypothetical protein
MGDLDGTFEVTNSPNGVASTEIGAAARPTLRGKRERVR